MRRFFIVVGLSALVVAAIAWGAPKQVGGIAGPGALAVSYTGQAGNKYCFQCPNQGARFRPGCSARRDAGVSCVNDAGPAVDGGPGDLVVEFGAVSDPFCFQLGAGEDKFWLRSTDAGSLSCSVLTP